MPSPKIIRPDEFNAPAVHKGSSASGTDPRERRGASELNVLGYDWSEEYLFDDPVAAIKRLAGRFYAGAMSGQYAPAHYNALNRTLTELLPYIEGYVASVDDRDWDFIEYRARHSLQAFTQITNSDYKVAAHHVALFNRIQATLGKGWGRLYTGMPPRHGKSEICSIRLPAWWLGNHPDNNVVLVCNTQELANEFSRQCRELVFHDPLYRRLFPAVLPNPDKQAVTNWRTTKGGGVRAVGVGASLTGHGADLLIIDDPHKDDDWLNDEQLDRVYKWFASSARTRLSPGAPIILLMTRWHTRDLAGRLLMESEGADEYESLVLPALALEGDVLGRAPGDALWPEHFDVEGLEKQRAVSEVVFQSLYQQNPEAFSDYVFEADDVVWIESESELDKDAPVFWTGDLALTMNDRSDYNVLARWRYQSGLLVLDDLRRYRGDTGVTMRVFAELTERYPDEQMYFPNDPIESAIRPTLADRFPRWGFPLVRMPRTDKRVKAQEAAALAYKRSVAYRRGYPGVDAFVSELLEFPNGTHDDCVDALACAAHVVRTWGAAGHIG